MGLWDYIPSFSSIFDIWNSFTLLLGRRKEAKVMFIGLDDAGKTTLMNMLAMNKMVQAMPTQLPTSQEFIYGNLNLTTIDLGGHVIVRKIWKEYFFVADAIVFILDACDRKRFPEAKAELDEVLGDEQTYNIPILILGNKIDRYYAAGEQEICDYFNLHSFRTGRGKVPLAELPQSRPIELFMCSIKEQVGYGEGIRWLAQYL